MADLITRAGKGSPLTNAEVDANFTNLNTDKVETGLAALDAYDTTIADTAVDVFVYDTSRDSDGGAWRHRTQHTSWYNETLDTATRGSRREFPAVAVIVAESDQVTIYDGDDPSLPMWMVFPYFATSNVTSVSMLNSKVVIGVNVTTTIGVAEYGFAADNGRVWFTAGNKPLLGGIADRPADNIAWNVVFAGSYTGASIINSAVNDVAMTVLPNAPIDAATGLPVPTIAVATGGGVSVIKDDGTVFSFGGSLLTTALAISTDNRFLTVGRKASGRKSASFLGDSALAVESGDGGNSFTAIYEMSDRFGSATQIAYDYGSVINDIPDFIHGGVARLSLVQIDGTLFDNSLVCDIRSTYNTGWMNGDIKGAFLSDTDDTDLSENDVASGFDFTDASWSIAGTGTITGANTFTMTSNGGAAGGNLLEAGVTYVVVFDITATSRLRMYNSGGSQTRQIGDVGSGSNLTGFFTFKAANPDIYFRLDSAGDVTINSLSIKLADADRSVRNKGLIVNGTITKDPVATGADLVAYSGFSAANYLEQPYNSDLDFGTGDFCIMGWVQRSAASDWLVDRMEGRDGSSNSWGFNIWQSAESLRFGVYENNGATSVISSTVMSTGIWYFFTAVRRSGVLEMYMQGQLEATTSGTARDVSYTGTGNPPPLTIGGRIDGSGAWLNGKAALIRISATAPTAEQIAKIYEDEKFLFQENAQATLYGSSDAVTALAHDEVTDLLHVGTSAGRSVFQGLRRVDNTTDAVGVAISAYDGLVVED